MIYFSFFILVLTEASMKNFHFPSWCDSFMRHFFSLYLYYMHNWCPACTYWVLFVLSWDSSRPFWTLNTSYYISMIFRAYRIQNTGESQYPRSNSAVVFSVSRMHVHSKNWGTITMIYITIIIEKFSSLAIELMKYCKYLMLFTASI